MDYCKKIYANPPIYRDNYIRMRSIYLKLCSFNENELFIRYNRNMNILEIF